jgi:hypothetical protein
LEKEGMELGEKSEIPPAATSINALTTNSHHMF